MAENVRALIAILVLSIPAFFYLRKPLTEIAIAPADYALRVRLWIALTATLFVVYSFWLFVLIAALALLMFGRKDADPPALYLFLLLLAPPFQASIDGFAGINRFLDIDYLRLLSLTVLLPIAVGLWRSPDTPRLFKMPADKYLLGYIVLLLVLQAPVTSRTDLLRAVVLSAIDVFLPYYVFSRALSDFARLRDALASFVGICAVVAVIALFETLKGWLLYNSLPDTLGVHWGYGHYMAREGALRATVSAGHSIVLGYLLTVGLGLHLALRPSFGSVRAWRIVFLLLIAGVIASMSRGPWMGAIALAVVATFAGAGAAGRIGKLILAAVLLVPLLMLTPYGAKLMSLMPFIGTAETDSVNYRQQLFDVAYNVILMNPIFGSPYYFSSGALEQMRQGEGIIDIVNSYLGIALGSGLAGLCLFLGVFLSSGARLVSYLVRSPDKHNEQYFMCRSLLATLAGVLTILATASSINAIPVVYWCLAGICAAFLRLVAAERYGVQSPSFRPNSRIRPASL